MFVSCFLRKYFILLFPTILSYMRKIWYKIIFCFPAQKNTGLHENEDRIFIFHTLPGRLSLTHSTPYPSWEFGHSSNPGSSLAPLRRYAFTFSP